MKDGERPLHRKLRGIKGKFKQIWKYTNFKSSLQKIQFREDVRFPPNTGFDK